MHGYVVAIGPEANRNYFTGASYSAYLDDAKVFRTPHGARAAVRYWQKADHNPNPLPAGFWSTVRMLPTKLKLDTSEQW